MVSNYLANNNREIIFWEKPLVSQRKKPINYKIIDNKTLATSIIQTTIIKNSYIKLTISYTYTCIKLLQSEIQ